MPGRDIFLSYSAKDEAIVGLALEKVEAAGLRCWFAPRDIPPGEFYAGQIIQALRESRFVLLFFSSHSNASEQVVREINFAVGQRLPMLVVRLDQTALSNDFEYLIRINQWLDLTHLSSDVERVDQIVARIRSILANSGPKASTAKAPVAMLFGDFEILADSRGKPIELGRGGMGVTYRARQTSMGGREVALKVIQPELLGDDNVRRRFLREAQLAGEIDHENVALVYLRGQEGDSYFYAMQLVEGTDLDRYVKANGPLNLSDALSVIAQVASALTAANSKGLIHRDIKPSNLMAVRRRNTLRIKLIDFGLAKQITQQDIHNSLSGKDEFKGTLAYASPEQCQAFPLDTRSDLYSLGVTLWFLLSGKVPFTGNLAAVSGAHVWAPLPLQQLPPLPQPVLELLQSLLAKSAADRPQTPGEVEDRAEQLLRSLPSDPVSGFDTVHVQPAAAGDVSPGPDDNSTLIGAPVLNRYLEPAVGQVREERFELLESLPEGLSGRLFRARERRGSDTRLVAVKFLHPSICAHDEPADSLKLQFVALQKLTLDHLVRYFALELGSEPPFMVREWVQGIPLTGVLRLKRGTLTPSEVSALVEPLPALLDALASSGLSLISVRLSKLWARLPSNLEPAKFETWAKQAGGQDWESRMALDPLSLRSLVSRPVQAESDVTLLPASRSLSLQQNRAGIQGRTPAQLLASVVYELLAGQPPRADLYRPIAVIPENANQRLKHALANESLGQSNASELWLALKTDFPKAPKVTPAIRQPQPDPVSRSTPTAPAERSTTPEPPPTAGLSGSKKLNRTQRWPMLVLGLLAAFITIVPLVSWLSSHRSLSQPSPTPIPEPTASQPPTPETAPTPSATPTPSPTTTNDQLARAAFDRGFAAADKGDDQQAIDDYSEAIRLKPDFAYAFYNRGTAYGNLKQNDKAIADYSEAIRLKPDYPEAFNNRGMAYRHLEQNDKAIADYSEAIRLKPDFAYAFNNRGIAYEDLKQYDKAIADSSEAIRLKPDFASAFNNRGNAYEDLKQYDKAIADYSEAIRLKPDDPNAFNNRGIAYEDLKQYDKAIADSSEAIRLKPDDPDAFNNRGNAYDDLKQHDKAIADYSEAIRLKPDYALAFYNRGIAYDHLKQYDKAIADYSEAIRLKPDYASAFNNRGNAYYHLKQYDKAIADYSEAIRLKPDHAQAYRNRGYCFDAMGKKVEADRDRAKAELLEKVKR